VDQYYFRFRTWWCHSHPKVKIYPQIKCRRRTLIHGRDLTTSGLQKQTFSILEFFFRLPFRPYHSTCNQRAILRQPTKFRPNRATRGGIMTLGLYAISRRRQRRCHTTSGFVFDNVTLPRKSAYIRKPNFVDISYPRLRYFRFRKTTVRHIGILVSILTKSPYSALAGFRFGDWRNFLQNVCIYQQTKFHSYSSLHSWDITISGSKNKRPPYWNSTSGFDFDHMIAVGMSFCPTLPNFFQRQKMTSFRFWWWLFSAILDFRVQ